MKRLAPAVSAALLLMALATHAVPQQTFVQDVTVYVTKTGAKYHRAGCQYLRQSQIAMKLSEAKKKYTACSKCNPPR